MCHRKNTVENTALIQCFLDHFLFSFFFNFQSVDDGTDQCDQCHSVTEDREEGETVTSHNWISNCSKWQSRKEKKKKTTTFIHFNIFPPGVLKNISARITGGGKTGTQTQTASSAQ